MATNRQTGSANDNESIDDNDEIIEQTGEERGATRLVALERGISEKQRLTFKSSAELDAMRKPGERIGLMELYRIWCTKGNSKWLNPAPAIKQLDKQARIFGGKASALSPLLKILIRLTQAEISPDAFLRYVVLPRMVDDFDWRNWSERHYSALAIIADLVIKTKQTPPFDQPMLGTANYRLSRDIVIVKYFARPLAKLSFKELSSQQHQKEYLKIWGELYLDNSLQIYFLKRNVLPALFFFSANLEFANLIQIMQNLPIIEASFREFYSSEQYEKDIDSLKIHLYHENFNVSLQARHKKKFTRHHFTKELRAYLRIMAQLLSARSGLYLCSYFAILLSRKKDPIIADALHRLLTMIRDSGGMYVYKWHADQVVNMPKDRIEQFLVEVQSNRGIHPQYPWIHTIFSRRTSQAKKDELQKLAEGLGLWDETLKKAYQIDELSERTILNHLKNTRPDARRLIEKAQHDIARGVEQNWPASFISSLDKIGPGTFRLVLKATVPALYTGYSFRILHETFTDLFAQRESLASHLHLGIQRTFPLATYKVETQPRHIEDKVRAKINLKTLEFTFGLLTQQPRTEITAALAPINAMWQEVDRRVRQMQSEGRLDISAEMLRRRNFLQTIMRHIETGGTLDKIIISVMAAAYFHNNADLVSAVAALVIGRYATNPNFASKLSVLAKDIAIPAIQGYQFEMMIRVCEDLIEFVINDQALQQRLEKIHESAPELTQLLLSLSRRNSTSLDMTDLDAALTRMLRLNALRAEQSQWLRLIVAESESKAKPVIFHLRLDKSPLDMYYGHMGGICLASHESEAMQPDFYVMRLSNLETQEIVGIALAVLERGPIAEEACRRWLAFGINIIDSIYSKLTMSERLLVYLHIREAYEALASRTNRPVVLAGVGDRMIISNSETFRNMIINYERPKASPTHVFMTELVYKPKEYAPGLLIIHPAKPETFRATNVLRKRS